MNHVLNKIQRLDEIYTGIEKLNINLINYKELDFPGGWQNEIGNRLEELECISEEKYNVNLINTRYVGEVDSRRSFGQIMDELYLDLN